MPLYRSLEEVQYYCFSLKMNSSLCPLGQNKPDKHKIVFLHVDFLINSQFAHFFHYVSLTGGTARIDFSLPPWSAAGNRTHVSRIPPTWDLLKDTLHRPIKVTVASCSIDSF